MQYSSALLWWFVCGAVLGTFSGVRALEESDSKFKSLGDGLAFAAVFQDPFPQVHNAAINHPAASSAMFRRPKVNDDLALDNAGDTHTGAEKHRAGGAVA